MHTDQRQMRSGFTLIELLVVIAIIGILSAIGLDSLNGAREKAHDAQRKNDLAQIRTGLILYYDEVEPAKYPLNSVGCHIGENGNVLVTKYLSRALAPTTGTTAAMQQYCYVATSNQLHFLVYTQLESGLNHYYYLNEGGGAAETTTPPTCTVNACAP